MVDNLQYLLTQNNHNQDKFTQSGVYKLTCADCGKAYTGQTDRDFKTRFNEHRRRSFQYNTPASKYAQHLTEHLHAFGDMHIMQVIQFQKKGIHLNTIELFHIPKKQMLITTLTMTTRYLPTIFYTVLKGFQEESQ